MLWILAFISAVFLAAIGHGFIYLGIFIVAFFVDAAWAEPSRRLVRARRNFYRNNPEATRASSQARMDALVAKFIAQDRKKKLAREARHAWADENIWHRKR